MKDIIESQHRGTMAINMAKEQQMQFKIGPRTEPCGIPHNIKITVEVKLSRVTLNILLDRQEEKQLRTVFSRPIQFLSVLSKIV